jgi:hypothetical protein
LLFYFKVIYALYKTCIDTNTMSDRQYSSTNDDGGYPSSSPGAGGWNTGELHIYSQNYPYIGDVWMDPNKTPKISLKRSWESKICNKKSDLIGSIIVLIPVNLLYEENCFLFFCFFFLTVLVNGNRWVINRNYGTGTFLFVPR